MQSRKLLFHLFLLWILQQKQAILNLAPGLLLLLLLTVFPTWVIMSVPEACQLTSQEAFCFIFASHWMWHFYFIRHRTFEKHSDVGTTSQRLGLSVNMQRHRTAALDRKAELDRSWQYNKSHFLSCPRSTKLHCFVLVRRGRESAQAGGGLLVPRWEIIGKTGNTDCGSKPQAHSHLLSTGRVC